MYAQLLTTPLDVIQYSYNIFNTKYSKDTFLRLSGPTDTVQKMKFPIKDFFSKYDQIRSFLWIWSHLLKESLMGTSFFCAVISLHGSKLRFFISATAKFHLTCLRILSSFADSAANSLSAL